MPVDYRPYALRYLLLWLEHDRDACRAIRDPGMAEPLRLQHVARAAQFFRVARNLHRQAGSVGHAHYAPLLRAIDGLPADFATAHDYPGAVREAERRIKAAYLEDACYTIHHRLTSLASKFLWLRFGTPILIYDNRARETLEVKHSHDLAAYGEAWRARFDKHRSAIRSACDALPEVLPFALCGTDDAEAAREVIGTPSFRERVLDNALWHKAAMDA